MNDHDVEATAAATDRLAAIRHSLEDEQHQLGAQVGDLDHVGNADLAFDENLSDRGQVAAEQGENKVLAARLRDQLDDVEFALLRLEEGTYGTCVTCGSVIADARLEAMPAARFCITCAS